MSEEVRVLHIISTLVSGGVQSVVLNYAAAVKPYGVVFDYVVQGRGNPEMEQACLEGGSKIYYLPQMTKHPISFIFELSKLLREHREYRILHTHHNFLNFIPLISAKKSNVPIRISHSHSYRETKKLTTKMVRLIARKLISKFGTEAWACSRNAYIWLYGNQYISSKSYILHNAIKTKYYRFSQENRNEIKARINLDSASFYLICVATLSANKNQSFLITILKKLPDNFKLLLVGDGPIKPQLMELAKTLEVEKRVLFLGDRKDVPDLLSAADCFVLPSKAEGLPVSIVEAEMNGLPCVVSDCISREVSFTENVWFEPIDEHGVEAWKKRLLQIEASNYEHISPPRDVVAASGYDISVEGKKLAQKYKELFER